MKKTIPLHRSVSGFIFLFAALVPQRMTAQGSEEKILQLRSHISHIIVIYEENWSFDALYGEFPGCDNLQQAGKVKQVDKAGTTLDVLPRPLIIPSTGNGKKPEIPNNLPVKPYNLLPFARLYERTGDLVHRF